MRTLALWLTSLMVFTIPWEDAINITGLGTVTRMIGILTAVFWLGVALAERQFRKPHPFHLFAFLFILWNMASFFWSFGGDETEQRIETYVQLGVLTWILWDLYTSTEALRSAMRAYILGGYITIFSTVYKYITGQGISTYETDRFAGAGTNANDLALILALGLPIAWYLAVTMPKDTRKSFLTMICYAYVPAALFSISLTASRMALFAALPAFVYILATAKRIKPLYGVLILAAFIGSVPFIPQTSIDRLGTTGTSLSTGDLGGRGMLWHASMGVFLQNPFLGIGSGVLSTAKFIGAAAHNTFLSVMAELGLIGLIFFVSMLAIVTVQALKQPKLLSRLWITVLSIWGIGVFTLTWEYRKTTWLLLSFVVISSSLYRKGQREMEGSLTSDYGLLRRGFSGIREPH